MKKKTSILPKRKSTKTSISHLPEEINTQILLLLPFESILTCKLVSKQWRNLISDPRFFKLYTPRGSMSLFLYKDNLFCIIPRPLNPLPGTLKGPNHPPFTVHRVPVDLRLGIWSEAPTTPSLLSGSSNGIACILRKRRDFVLHNLFNGTSFTVDPPAVEFERERPVSFSWECFGSGYNRSGDDYHIVVAQVSYKLGHHPEYPDDQNGRHYKYWEHVVEVEDKDRWFSVYSVPNQAWKQLKGFPFTAEYRWYQPYSRQACAFNGVLHWLVKGTETRDELVIVTYDLRTGRFGTILLPRGFGLVPHSYSHDSGPPTIAELNGQLCCWRFGPVGRGLGRFRMWVMEEYDVRDSWTELINTEDRSRNGRMLSVSSCNDLKNFDPTSVMGPFELRNGKKGWVFVSEHRKRALCWYGVDNHKIIVISKSDWSREEYVLSRDQDLGYIDKFLG